MNLWLIAAIPYGLCAIAAARAAAGAIAWSWAPGIGRRDGTPDGGQWFGAVVVGVMIGAVWPLALLVWKMPAPVIGAEREHRLRERERMIKEAEKELGIR